MKRFFIICLCLCLFSVSFVFAQEENNKINETSNLSLFYQVTNDSLNRLIYTLTFIASVLMLFFLIGTATLLYKQYEVDKEIRRYRDEIKQKKIIFENELELSLKRLKEREEQAEKIVKTIGSKKPRTSKESKETQVLLEKFKKEIQKLYEEIEFQKGRISTVSGTPITSALYENTLTSGVDSSSVFFPGIVSATRDLGDSSFLTRNYGSLGGQHGSSSKICPNCSYTNALEAKFCSQCGKKF